jgi:hypothetical protein
LPGSPAGQCGRTGWCNLLLLARSPHARLFSHHTRRPLVVTSAVRVLQASEQRKPGKLLRRVPHPPPLAVVTSQRLCEDRSSPVPRPATACTPTTSQA